jgi:CHAT domain-containing protein
MERLAQLGPVRSAQRSGLCPPAGVWLELAVGIYPDSEALIRHAAGCDYCAGLLRDALGDLTGQCTAQEEAFVGELATADPVRQKVLAQQLASGVESPHPPSSTRSGFSSGSRPRRVGFWGFYTVAATVLVILGILLARHRIPASSPETLLADAYSEHRTLELRFAGARHSPIRLERGGNYSDLDKPQALLRAESMLAEQLRKQPNNPALLNAKARADLMDGNFAAALQALDRALEVEPDSLTLQTDLATAYFAQAEATGQTIDYGRAVDNLGSVLAKSPDDSLALFNRAIAEERLFLYDEATADWEHFLRVEPDPAWRDEGHQRLHELQERMHEREQSRVVPLHDPSAAIAALGAIGSSGKSRPLTFDEQYLDVATKEWFYALGSARTSRDPPEEELATLAALRALADVMHTRHHDDWLKELLGSPLRPPWRSGVRELAEAFHANAVGDIGAIAVHATRARAFFREAGNPAGQDAADLLFAVAMNRAERGNACLSPSKNLVSRLSYGRYPWIEIKALFALSSCELLNGNPKQADVVAQKAQQLARTAQYPELELNGLYYEDGVTTSWVATRESWERVCAGLRIFWQSPYPPVHGADFYTDLGFAAETEGMWHMAERVGDEELRMSLLEGDAVYVAAAHHWLAQVAEAAGDGSLAETEYERAAVGLPGAGMNSEAARTTLEIERSALEVRQGKFDLAAARLHAIRPSFEALHKQYATILYLEAEGALDARQGQTARAKADLEQAIALIERNRNSLDSDGSIYGWQKTTGEAYKSLVELYHSQHQDDESFAMLEWSRAGSLRATGNNTTGISTAGYVPQAVKLRPGTALVTWMSFSNGLGIWLLDSDGLHTAWTSVPQAKLEMAAHTFASLCADPSSDPRLLDQQAHRLYEWLFAPLDSALTNATTIVVEPDDLLNTIPFQALRTQAGRYLGEQYQFVESPGLGYARQLRSGRDISPNSVILAVGDPLITAAAGRHLRRLPAADTEAHDVAMGFHRRHLMTGNQATLNHVLASLPEAEVFHFAGHAVTQAREPGLLLTSSGSDQATLLGEAQLAPRAMSRLRLAVLSACNTADAEQGPADPANLVLLFLRAGVPHVVASKWPVDSEVSSTLMKKFYGRLLRGEAVDEALAAAEQEVRSQPETSHPYYWAAFAAFGGE